MKIWIINHYATPPEQGTSTRHYALVKELEKYNHEITVIAASVHHLLKNKHNKYSQELKAWQDSAVKFIFLSTPEYQDNSIERLWNMLCFAWQVIQLPRRIDYELPDIIIGSSVHPFAVWAAERIAAKYKLNFCFEVRDLWPQTLIDMKVISKYHPLTIILSKLEVYLYKKASLIITLLPYAHEYISKLGISASKIEYLPNGVDLDLFKDISPPQDSKEHLTIMYLGAHGPANGLDTLVEAAAELEENQASKQVYWRLIGEGPEKEHLKVKIENLGLQSIKLENSVSKLKVPQVIQEADILVFHLLNVEVFQYGISPNKLFDYLASQRPIVFGCAARNNPVAEAGAGITVSPEDPKAMAEAIRQLAELPLSQRIEMGKRGRDYVEQNHSYRYLGARLNSLLEKVLWC
ncbi:MAG: glycosyltransferase family 4 protein [Symploca sp. SIO2E9]|nr:glycosyltransferase family 4 protein [Symploca sp. SIO2E9]